MKTAKTLLKILEELEIEDFTLDSKQKTLEIGNKQDFDKYLDRFPGVKARTLSPNQNMSGDLPYGALHWAWFHYEGWEIKGNIVHQKTVS